MIANSERAVIGPDKKLITVKEKVSARPVKEDKIIEDQQNKTAPAAAGKEEIKKKSTDHVRPESKRAKELKEEKRESRKSKQTKRSCRFHSKGVYSKENSISETCCTRKQETRIRQKRTSSC